MPVSKKERNGRQKYTGKKERKKERNIPVRKKRKKDKKERKTKLYR